MIWPPGIDTGAFVVSPDTVWYARVLLLFSTSATTDTGSKTSDHRIVPSCRRWKHTTIPRMVIICIISIISIIKIIFILMIITAIIAIMLIIFVLLDV